MPKTPTLQGLAGLVEQQTEQDLQALNDQTQKLLAQHAQSLTDVAQALQSKAESEMRSAASAKVRQIGPWLGLTGLLGIATALTLIAAASTWWTVQQAAEIRSRQQKLAELKTHGLTVISTDRGEYLRSTKPLPASQPGRDGLHHFMPLED